ncbi:MAG: DUF5103 domain-containing protein [Tannerella sp.]|jgi:hypothetical protein|nr:DUF5103 domain-containing protein [Tannerella sp.]
MTTVLLYLYTDVTTNAQEKFRTEIFRDDIKSLEIKVEGEIFSNPYVELNSDKQIEIIFDALHRVSGRFAYSIVHCNADWTQSSLLPIEYMKGFQGVVIEDFANSFNTIVNYTNYKLTFPNIDVQLTASGNYAVKIYDEDTPEKTDLIACFSIVEPIVLIEADVSGNTDLDFNREHQQVNITVDYSKLSVNFPQNEFKTVVYQNNNQNDIRRNLQPQKVINNKMIFEHDKNLIFEAGNEYRRFEFSSSRYNGIGVEDIEYFRPYYNATLFQGEIRANKSYLYDQDQNGRFFTNCGRCADPYTEADYYIVHFSLASDYFESGDVYLFGNVFNNNFNERNRMEYNAKSRRYEKAIMLKQGLYNYQYAYIDKDTKKISLRKIEGNFFETENEYTIAVYHRPPGARYDRLTGIKTISSNHGLMGAASCISKHKTDSVVRFK